MNEMMRDANAVCFSSIMLIRILGKEASQLFTFFACDTGSSDSLSDVGDVFGLGF